MTLPTSIWLFQSVYATGLTVWLAIAVIDNIRTFRELAGAVGITMSMALLHQAPPIETALATRAMTSSTLSRIAAAALLALKLLALSAMVMGSFLLVFATGIEQARPWLNLALTLFTVLLLAMHLGGLWFAYWIRQDDLQRGHLTLLVWILSSFFLFNGSWA